jgi:hypothetical protein
MAALTTQNVGAGGAITTQAAAGGGDTIELGILPGGWYRSPPWLHATVGTTATTITVAGTPFGPFTSQTVVIPINNGTKRGTTAAVTYSQVTNVNVAAVQFGPKFVP